MQAQPKCDVLQHVFLTIFEQQPHPLVIECAASMYNKDMKVWRAITYSWWLTLFSLMFTISMGYLVLNQSLLQPKQVKQTLAASTTYESVRDGTIARQIVDGVTDAYPENELIDYELVRPILVKNLPKEELATDLEPSIDSLYAWLDSKEPDFTITLPIDERLKPFYADLEPKLASEIAKLPQCPYFSSNPAADILAKQCRPLYLSADELSGQLVAQLSSATQANTTINKSTIAGSSQLRNLPSYLNYAYFSALISAGVALITGCILLISRKLRGLLGIGLVILETGIVFVVIGVFASNYAPDIPRGVQSDIINQVLLPLLSQKLVEYGGIILGAGAMISATTGFILWRRRGSNSQQMSFENK